LCQRWLLICSICRRHNTFLASSFKSYYQICNKSNTTGATSYTRTAYPSWAPEFIPGFLNAFLLSIQAYFLNTPVKWKWKQNKYILIIVKLPVFSDESFPEICLITRFITRATRRVPLVTQELHTLPEPQSLFLVFFCSISTYIWGLNTSRNHCEINMYAGFDLTVNGYMYLLFFLRGPWTKSTSCE
jgi:hypothetical protein